MPSKDKAMLDNLLEMPAPPPVLRRGRGVELSTVPSEIPAPVAAPIVAPVASAPPPVASAVAHDRTVAPSHNREDDDTPAAGPRRVNRGYKIREDLVKALKRVALDEDRKLFEVMEDAFERYLSAKATG